MTYFEHFRANMLVAGRSLLSAFFHAAHAVIPVRWTSHDYWGIYFGKPTS